MRYLPLALLAAACGDPDPGTSIDGGADAAQLDAAIDAGPCAGRELTGEYLDWDSSNASFLGIADARFTTTGAPSSTATTAPNGRFILCAPAGDVQLSVDAPDPYVDTLAYIDDGTIQQSMRPLSLRSFTATRAPSFYAERGLVYDAAKAHVLVYQSGDRTPRALDRAHGTTQSAEDPGDGSLQWGNDAEGRYILFPNVTAAEATATISGAPNGPHTVPIAPGTLTYAALYFVYL